jgi:glycosyltransferase involved in cell wall biosynthesis
MRILIVHKVAIPVFAYGGTERVVWDLGRALVDMGHAVSFLVPQGSRCDFAPIIAINPRVPLAQQIPSGFDVVHFHFDPGFELGTPWLMTEHGNTRKPTPFPLNTVFVSNDHAQRYGASAFVYNGMDWRAYGDASEAVNRAPTAAGAGYFHFLGKGSWPVKNLLGAIDVAHAAGVRLEVLGGRRLNLSHKFRMTWSRKIGFHGMVGGEVKNRWLAGSSGMIFPVRWHEPFGLAIIESMYFGCPIFATPYGAIPEIVGPEHGVLATDGQTLAQAIRLQTATQKFSRRACHERAKSVFDHMSMARAYLRMYERMIAGEQLNAKAPLLPSNGKALLAWHMK